MRRDQIDRGVHVNNTSRPAGKESFFNTLTTG
jgi:hypothetical protein